MSTKNAVVVALVLSLSLLAAPVALAVENGGNSGSSVLVSTPAALASVPGEVSAPSFSDLLLGFLSSIFSPLGENSDNGIGLAPRTEDRGPGVEPNRV